MYKVLDVTIDNRNFISCFGYYHYYFFSWAHASVQKKGYFEGVLQLLQPGVLTNRSSYNQGFL